MMHLFFDMETTGLDEQKNDILTAYFAIYNENLEFIDDLDLMLKPDDPNKVIIYDIEAFETTGINLEDHLKNPATITYSKGRELLTKMLIKHKIPNKRSHYRYSGQNIGFDIKFLKEHMGDSEGFEKLINHGNIDTFQIATFLKECDMIAADVGNLGSLVDYFGLPMGTAHNAKEDVLMTVNVYRAMKNMMKDKKAGMSGVADNDLLSIVEL